MIFTALLFAWSVLAQNNPIEGYWRQSCLNGMQKEVVSKDNNARLIENYFDDSLCSSPSVTVFMEGEFQVGDVKEIPNGSQEINFIFQNVFVKPISIKIVEYLNQQKVCGWNNWKTNEWKNISGLVCSFDERKYSIPQRGELRYGVYKVEKNFLFFGKFDSHYNGSKPELRPLVWDPYPYLKQ